MVLNRQSGPAKSWTQKYWSKVILYCQLRLSIHLLSSTYVSEKYTACLLKHIKIKDSVSTITTHIANILSPSESWSFKNGVGRHLTVKLQSHNQLLGSLVWYLNDVVCMLSQISQIQWVCVCDISDGSYDRCILFRSDAPKQHEFWMLVLIMSPTPDPHAHRNSLFPPQTPDLLP